MSPPRSSPARLRRVASAVTRRWRVMRIGVGGAGAARARRRDRGQGVPRSSPVLPARATGRISLASGWSYADRTLTYAGGCDHPASLAPTLSPHRPPAQFRAARGGETTGVGRQRVRPSSGHGPSACARGSALRDRAARSFVESSECRVIGEGDRVAIDRDRGLVTIFPSLPHLACVSILRLSAASVSVADITSCTQPRRHRRPLPTARSVTCELVVRRGWADAPGADHVSTTVRRLRWPPPSALPHCTSTSW